MKTEEFFRKRDYIERLIHELFEQEESHFNRMNLHRFLRNVIDEAFMPKTAGPEGTRETQ